MEQFAIRIKIHAPLHSAKAYNSSFTATRTLLRPPLSAWTFPNHIFYMLCTTMDFGRLCRTFVALPQALAQFRAGRFKMLAHKQ
jgi:hypothetical protein